MKKAISLLLVIVMTTIALAGCGSKSENPAGNADSNQPADESITIKNSPDKYTWYIKNYVGKNCASIGYTSMGGDRMDHYGAGYIELVMVTPDGAYIDIESDDDLKQYVIKVYHLCRIWINDCKCKIRCRISSITAKTTSAN